MKLKLESVRDINVLVVTGPIEAGNSAVLKAGIKKLLKEGKNKIILELLDSSTIPMEILRDFSELNSLAAELAGQIVFANIGPSTRAKIESFSKQSIHCFVDRQTATEFFYPKLGVTSPVSAPSHASALDPSKQLEAEKQIKAQNRTNEMGELGDLRKRIKEVELENRELKGLLKDMVVSRRDPPDLDTWKEKILRLEKDLSDAIAAAQTAAATKK